MNLNKDLEMNENDDICYDELEEMDENFLAENSHATNNNEYPRNEYPRNEYPANEYPANERISSEEKQFVQNEEIDSINHSSPKKKRGLPKSILINQQKHIEALEKQKKMMNSKKKNCNKNDKKKNAKKSDNPKQDKIITSVIPSGTRRVIIAGKVKYIPIKKDINGITATEKTSIETLSDDKNDMNKKINPTVETLIRTLEMNNLSKTERDFKNKEKNEKSMHRIPGKYAKQIEKDVKKQTVKNIKNFSDLRRIRAIQDIDTDMNIDANKASIIELRKLRIEQRKKEQIDQKKRYDANKRESAIQEILNNDKMTKFGKAIAIKNLSVNSRTKKMSIIENHKKN